MLIEFSLANFRSFEKRQTFSMVSGTGDEMREANTFKPKSANQFELLHSSVIYGSNATGKSNFLRGLKTMREIILNSASKLQYGDKLPIVPFRLNESSNNQPSEFEVIFIAKDNIRYQYGFTATSDYILDEWLIAYPKGSPQHWFNRRWNKRVTEYEWNISKNLQGSKLVWQNTTRSNALFLSNAVHLNSEQLKPIYDWFKDTLQFIAPNEIFLHSTIKLIEKENSDKDKILNFLKAADINIVDLILKKELFDINKFPEKLSEEVKEIFLKKMDKVQSYEIYTLHENKEGNKVEFKLKDESEGTQKLFAFSGVWLNALENGKTLMIDELENSLHYKLVKFVIQLFHTKRMNPNHAQLIFTTHNTSILDQEIFRRDQVWFCKIDNEKSSILYPLTDFSPRKKRENLERSYLSGRYEALPFIIPSLLKSTKKIKNG